MKLRATRSIGIFCVTLQLMANSCGYPISKQLRMEAEKDTVTLAIVLADPAASKGKIALWGGKVIEITNTREGTEMIILEAPLDFLGEPQSAQSSRGRFIARIPKFLDPAIYLADREITIAGEVIGVEEQELGSITYKYPVVSIKELHLWEKLSPQYPADTWHDPQWRPHH